MMETFPRPKEVEEKVDNSEFLERENISEKWILFLLLLLLATIKEEVIFLLMNF